MAARKRGPKDQLRESTITIRQNLEGLYDGKHRPEAFAGLGAIRQPPGAILITALPTQSRLLVDGYGAFRDPRFQPIVDDCVLKLCAQLALIEQPTGVEIRRQRVLKGKRPDPPFRITALRVGLDQLQYVFARDHYSLVIALKWVVLLVDLLESDTQ
ncbi:hypothetical protein PLESTM_001454000 [Pleodorina starrii]|nr:hypothetical protein PLESTM_001454000 [Pleodorina starrii]